MFTKFLYKPIFIHLLFLISLSALLSLVLSFFISHYIPQPLPKDISEKKIEFKLSKTVGLKIKKRIIKKQKKQKVKSIPQEFILTDFTVNSILLSNGDDMVIIDNPKGGIFLHINDSYKGYKFVKAYRDRAKFKKSINTYWAFLNPDDEKQFKENRSKISTKKSNKNSILPTVSREMFEKIIHKNGKYYIPQDIIEKYSNLSNLFPTFKIASYNVYGKLSFKILYLTPGSVLTKLGLRVGDFITKINGRDFKSLNEPLKLFQNIKNVKQLRLTIKRDNKLKELKYEVY